MMMDTYVGLTAGYGGPLGTAPALACLRQPVNLMVNQNGHRFMREDLCSNPGYTGNAVHRQRNGCAISLLDEQMYQAFLQAEKEHPSGPPPSDPTDAPHVPEPFERFNGIPMPKIIQDARESGCYDFFMADSLEEFAQQADLPYDTLHATIEEYNAACEAHEDSISTRHPDISKKSQGPNTMVPDFSAIPMVVWAVSPSTNTLRYSIHKIRSFRGSMQPETMQIQSMAELIRSIFVETHRPLP